MVNPVAQAMGKIKPNDLLVPPQRIVRYDAEVFTGNVIAGNQYVEITKTFETDRFIELWGRFFNKEIVDMSLFLNINGEEVDRYDALLNSVAVIVNEFQVSFMQKLEAGTYTFGLESNTTLLDCDLKLSLISYSAGYAE